MVLLDAGAPVYSWNLGVAPGVTIAPVCRTFAPCPELTTCVLTESRLTDELATFRAPGKAPTAFGRTPPSF